MSLSRRVFLEVETPRPNLRKLLWISVAVWIPALVLTVILHDADTFQERFVEAIASNIHGLALGIIVAGLLFDRLREQARVNAEAEAVQIRAKNEELLGQLWDAEYSFLYGQLVEDINKDLASLGAMIYQIVRVQPIRRALELYHLDPRKLRLSNIMEHDIPMRLNFIRRMPGQNGHTALKRLSDVIKVVVGHLEAGDEFGVHGRKDDYHLDVERVKLFLQDMQRARDDIRTTLGRMRSSILQLDQLHRASIGEDTIETPEYAFSFVYRHLVGLEIAESDWRWAVQDKTDIFTTADGSSQELVHAAAEAALSASRMIESAAELYQHLMILHDRLDTRYMSQVQGLHWEVYKRMKEGNRSDDESLEIRADNLQKGIKSGLPIEPADLFRAAVEEPFLQPHAPREHSQH